MAGWCSIVVVPAVVFAQGSFVTSGGEYSITGKLPGDQVYPCVNFTTNGGYITWQDNWIDRDGLGVGAMRLNPDLTTSGNVVFRVNSLTANNQQNAHVSMLNNGGAVFAWQGGRHGFQHIYCRFLSPSNSWVTGDIQANSATSYYQTAPVIATLLNGNVVIAYTSMDQAGPGSMADVYLQMFTPDGNKVGNEIPVNQFTSNNQRAPAIAALADGSFVVAWVSEQERWTDANSGVPSVDIYARTFDSTGAALGSEFLLNVSSNICDAPQLAASPDGGFMAVWTEKDMVIPNNGMDIYARRFAAPVNGAAVGGNETRLNTQLYGDQYAPRISRAGTMYLAVWTSLDQDGSREGVFGTYVNDDATTSGNEFQVNTTTFGPQMEQTVGSDGTGRFLAAWTSFTGSTGSGFDLFAQQYINPAAAVTNLGGSGLFSTDPNANPNSVSNSPPPPSLPSPVSEVNSNPGITNTFNDVKGQYSGLVYDPDSVSPADSGSVTITTTASGSFTAKLQMAGKNYSFSGHFSASGTNVSQAGPWTVNLLLDLHGGYSISGQAFNGNSTNILQAYLAGFSKTSPTPLAGNYTMVIQPGDVTLGNAIGTVSVNSSGNVNCNVTLPDGTRLNEKTVLSKSGAWPIYASLYKGSGMFIGWMQFSGAASNGFTGQCVWTAPGGTAASYSAAFTNVLGSLYKSPPLMFAPFGKSQIVLSGGSLSAPITNSVMWGPNNKIANLGPNKLSMSLNTPSGLFKGTIVDPTTRKGVPFQGVLYEQGNTGLGFFSSANQSGGVSFAPNP